jgi:succinoglycan biosynthesis transport protein ExoP
MNDRGTDLPAENRPPEPARTVNVTGIQLDAYRVYRNSDHQPEAPVVQGGEFSLRDILYILFRHKWKIVLIFITGAVGAVSYVVTTPDYYASEARILIQNDRGALTVRPGGGGDGRIVQEASTLGTDALRTELGILKSPEVMGAAVDLIGADRILRSALQTEKPEGRTVVRPPSRIQVVKRWYKDQKKQVMGKLNLLPTPLGPREGAIVTLGLNFEAAQTMGGSGVLKLTYAARNPVVARDVLEAIIKAYQEVKLDLRERQRPDHIIQSRIAEVEIRLRETNSQLDKMRRELNVSSLQDEKKMLSEQLSSLEGQQKSASIEIDASRAKIESIQKSMGDRAKFSLDEGLEKIADPAVDEARKKLTDLRLQEIDMGRRYKPESREMRELRQRIKETESMIGKMESVPGAVRRNSDPVKEGFYTMLETERAVLASNRAKLAALNIKVDEVRGSLNNLSSHETELGRLEDQAQTLQEQRKMLVKGQTDIQIDEMLTSSRFSNVQIVQPAMLPFGTLRSQRKKMALMGIGIVMGLVAGAALAFVIEFMDHSLKTNEDVERRLGLPVLVAIPRVRNPKPLPEKEVA